MKKVFPLTLVLIGTALLITAVVFWIDSNTSAEPQSFGQSLRDWITLIAGLGASIKGWMDLFKKDKPSTSLQSNISGGINISGEVKAVAGSLAGRDIVQTYVTEDSVYNVDGLPNPYLGLQAFTYNERDRYAGREKLTEEALQLFVSPGEQRNLLFVTGASGSGKSSFVQASLLPALINYYHQRGKTVKFEVFRPSRNPNTRLNEGVKRLGLRNIQVIIIDQFEELFTQSLPYERNALLEFLKRLQPFEKSHRFVIATLRSDYLGEMFDVQWLWEIAKQGVELREMRIRELKDAILRPLQAKFPNGDKRFDLKLVEKLAEDTAESVSYLPLLQVTLEELWNKGQLKLGAYNSLADAIKERADTVLAYRDFDRAYPIIVRTAIEREEILSILLALVSPTQKDDVNHDVRISRKSDEFSDNQIFLLRELGRARLVTIEVEDGVEYVNLIHEALIHCWDVLRNAIKAKRLQLQKRSRFEEQLRLWDSHEHSADYLLSKGQLVEALELDSINDISTRISSAQEFLQNSAKKIDADQILEQEFTNRLRDSALAREISSSLNFDELLIKCVNYIHDNFGYYHVSIYLRDPSFKYVVVCEGTGEAGVQMKRARYQIAIGSESIVGYVSSHGEALIVDDTIKVTNYHKNPFLLETRAEAAFPIKFVNSIIGVLNVHSNRSNVFTVGHIDRLETLSGQLAPVIVNNELLFKYKKRHIQINALGNITNSVAAAKTLEGVMERAVFGLQEAFGGDCAMILLVNREKRILEVKASTGYAEDVRSLQLAIDSGVAGWVASSLTPLLVSDVSKAPGYVPVNSNTQSELAVPLIYGNELLGVLIVESREIDTFTEDDIYMLNILGGGLAATINNVQLLKEIRSKEEGLQGEQKADYSVDNS
jgi:GAF domain-containing protein